MTCTHNVGNYDFKIIKYCTKLAEVRKKTIT